MDNVLVTGATGFIGTHLVRHLTERGHRVTCLVRSTSNRSSLEPFAPHFAVGDLADADAVDRAVRSADVVFNLAGTTKALKVQDFERANVDGARVIAESCANQDAPPTLVHVSSLAAAGPSDAAHARTETDQPRPVSHYGKSKLRGEHVLRPFADSVPISIVRPPIVVGPGDRDGFEMFKSIANWSLHLVPGFSDHRFSVVHVDDLCQSLIHVAERGNRIDDASNHGGVYFTGHHEIPTYAELGLMIGRALRRRVRIVRSPLPLIWTVAAVNETISRLRGRPHILSLDKAREANAGSWSCRVDRLCQETGFRYPNSLQDRIDQTAHWYCENGWIRG